MTHRGNPKVRRVQITLDDGRTFIMESHDVLQAEVLSTFADYEDSRLHTIFRLTLKVDHIRNEEDSASVSPTPALRSLRNLIGGE